MTETEKDPWQLKLPWMFALLLGLAEMTVLGIWGVSGAIVGFMLEGSGITFLFFATHRKLSEDFKAMGHSIVGVPLSIGAIAFMVLLLVSFLTVTWNANPFYDLLFLRSDGPFLGANHVTSELAVWATAAVFILKDWRNGFKTMLIIFSTVTIHEWLLAPWTFAVDRFNFDPRSYFWLGLILTLGFYFANKEQRKTLGYTALFFAVWLEAAMVLILRFNIPYIDFAGGGIGPAYFNPISAAIEVTGWVGIMAVWWVRGFDRKSS